MNAFNFQLRFLKFKNIFFIKNRFVPDKGFQGADKVGTRPDGPVVFEQETNFDPFQIDDFLGNLKQKSSKPDESVKEPSKKKRK
jgi:hypothetical protein